LDGVIGAKSARRGHRPISTEARLSLFVAGVALLLGLSICVLISATWRSEQDRTALAVAETAALALEGPAAQALAQGEVETLRRSAMALAAEPHVAGVEIVDAEGRSVVSAGEAGDAQVRGAIAWALKDGGATYRAGAARGEYVAGLRDGDGLIGAVRVSLDREAMRRGQAAPIWAVLAILVGILAVALPLTVIFTRRRLAPLRDLTRFAQEAAPQRPGHRLAIRSGDEFQVLAEAMNAMADRVDAGVKKLSKLAYVDPITELPNQDRFLRETSAAVAALDAERSIAVVMLLRFDRLQPLLEALESRALADLLGHVARRLSSSAHVVDRMVRAGVCASQPAIVARMSGIEFGVLAPLLESTDAAARFAQLLTTSLAQPLEIGDQRFDLTPSVGAVVMPGEAQDAEAALRHARLALSAANAEQKPLRFFTRALDRTARAKLQLERDMRAGLTRNEFRAHFQPKVNLFTGRIQGCEALARWQRLDQRSVGPGQFIPIAEQFGMIAPVADAIFRDACAAAAEWARRGLPADLAVNASVLQLNDERFAQRIAKALQTSGFDPRQLTLEITESVAMTNLDRVTAAIEPLRAIGVRFALDDFGTGHSGLAVLSRLPFDIIKIDQHFIRGLAKERQAPSIVQAILAMAQSLNLETVAEGVETEEQADFLRANGCTLAQGCLYGPALDYDTVTSRLSEEGGTSAAANG
jgi:EAL domain-containing protein (putative c-di-GMP-specific phosphodiesterase class I)/GGDEF domain-containing protein